jgi:hypothetical protein
MNRKFLVTMTVMFLLVSTVSAQGADPKQAMGKIKQNLNASMKALAGYEWMEITTVFKDGEAKSKLQNKCSYGADGKVIKVPVTDPSQAQEKAPRGVRGKVVENKKEEMGDYVEKCVAKIHEYLPPNSEKLQSIYNSGKTNVQVLEPNKKYKLEFPDYLQAGDKLGVSLDMEKGLLGGIGVNTYVDGPNDKVSLQLRYGLLGDGTEYPAETVLEMPSKGLKVVVNNEGHKKK